MIRVSRNFAVVRPRRPLHLLLRLLRPLLLLYQRHTPGPSLTTPIHTGDSGPIHTGAPHTRGVNPRTAPRDGTTPRGSPAGIGPGGVGGGAPPSGVVVGGSPSGIVVGGSPSGIIVVGRRRRSCAEEAKEAAVIGRPKKGKKRKKRKEKR